MIISLYISLIALLFLTFLFGLGSYIGGCYNGCDVIWEHIISISPASILLIPTIANILAIYNYHKFRIVKKWQIRTVGYIGIIFTVLSLYLIITDFPDAAVYIWFLGTAIIVSPPLFIYHYKNRKSIKSPTS